MGQEKQALLRSISAYVPALIARRAMAAPRSSMAGQEERMHTALLFADVSGFTAMSESLAQLGKEGAEELTRVLNAYFTAMIDLVRGYGGQAIKFGGDAVTCAFTNPQIGKSANRQICKSAIRKSAICNLPICDLQTEVLRACACAMAMQKRMADFRAVETRGGVFELRMKIGISAGSVLSLSVGDQQEGLEYVLAGRPLDRMAQAEHRATAGEVVMDTEWLADVGMRATPDAWEEVGIIVGEEREGFLPVKGLARPVGGGGRRLS